MINQLNQFESYSLSTQQKLNVVGGRYSSAYRAVYQDDDGSLISGYVAKDKDENEWVFLYWKDDELKAICIAGIDPD